MIKEEFYYELNNEIGEHRDWRYGQAAFNLMHMRYPEIASKFRGSDFDPFYHNDRTQIFVDKCFEMMDQNVGQKSD